MAGQDYIYFLNFEMRPAVRQLLQSGAPVPLGARAFDLLLFLIECRDRVVARDELMLNVWDGLVVGDNNLNVQVSLLRKLLGAQSIVTVPGRGLRFGFEVRDHLLHETEAELPLPDKPSVVVLPFVQFGLAHEINWLPDSIVEDITTELSRFRNLLVVARNSAFTYRNQPTDVRQISRQLGVRYVVEGSVRMEAERLRVTVQLIDALNGGHVWAENFESDLDEHFQMLGQITRTVVTALAPQIDAAECSRIQFQKPDSLDAYGLAQRGWAMISAQEMTYDPTPRDQAMELAEQVITIDPNSPMAWRTIAWVCWWHAYHGTTPSIPDSLSQGIMAADRAIDSDNRDHHARRVRGLFDALDQQPQNGLERLKQAHEINPNCAITLCWLGLFEALHGDADKGVPYAEAGLRLSPRDPLRGSMLVTLGFAQFSARDYVAAALTAEHALNEASGSATPLLLGAISWIGSGQIEKARVSFQRLKDMAPKLAEERLGGRWLSTNEDYQTRAHIFLRIAAGLENMSKADTLR